MSKIGSSDRVYNHLSLSKDGILKRERVLLSDSDNEDTNNNMFSKSNGYFKSKILTYSSVNNSYSKIIINNSSTDK